MTPQALTLEPFFRHFKNLTLSYLSIDKSSLFNEVIISAYNSLEDYRQGKVLGDSLPYYLFDGDDKILDFTDRPLTIRDTGTLFVALYNDGNFYILSREYLQQNV